MKCTRNFLCVLNISNLNIVLQASRALFLFCRHGTLLTILLCNLSFDCLPFSYRQFLCISLTTHVCCYLQVFYIYCGSFLFCGRPYLTCRFMVRTGSQQVHSGTWSPEPWTEPIGEPKNQNLPKPKLAVQFGGSKFKPRFRTKLWQPYRYHNTFVPMPCSLYRGTWFKVVLRTIPVFPNVIQTVWWTNRGAEPYFEHLLLPMKSVRRMSCEIL